MDQNVNSRFLQLEEPFATLSAMEGLMFIMGSVFLQLLTREDQYHVGYLQKMVFEKAS